LKSASDHIMRQRATAHLGCATRPRVLLQRIFPMQAQPLFTRDVPTVIF
jgi:hypothetical protein